MRWTEKQKGICDLYFVFCAKSWHSFCNDDWTGIELVIMEKRKSTSSLKAPNPLPLDVIKVFGHLFSTILNT